LSVGGYYSFREFKFGIEWLFIGKSLFASAIMAAVLYLLHPESDSAVIGAAVVGMAVYGAVLLLTKGLTEKEVSFFLRLLRVKV